MDLLAGALLTYLLHSTLLLLAAALLTVALRGRRLVLQEAALRAALVGGFLTTALQLGLGLTPLGGIVPVPDALVLGTRPSLVRGLAPAPAGRPLSQPDAAALATLSDPGVREPIRHAEPYWQARVVAAPSALQVLAERVAEAARPTRAIALDALSGAARSWKRTLAFAWAALSLFALSRLAVAVLRLGRLLQGRWPLSASELASRAAGVAAVLGLRRPVRLSAAPRLRVPLATGVLRPEVCLPTRAVAELGPDEQIALCAHELAHVARHDPAWILLAHVAEVLAPLQPLNVWARRRLQDISECLSDDLAVEASASPLGLARSLVDVASWTLGRRTLLPGVAAGAFGARSRLGQRVERLMDPLRSLERPRRHLLPLAAVAVLATAIVTPAVSGRALASAATDDVVASAPASPSTPEAPPAPPTPPAPAARPAPPAPPAPAARLAPAARPAPAPRPALRPAPAAASADAAEATDAEETSEAEERLERLSEQIAERAAAHEPEMKKLEREIEALADRMKPNAAELERFGKDIEEAAAELATAVADGIAHGEAAVRSDRARAAARRMAELQERIQESTKQIRIPEAELQALTERARELAELVKPSAEDVRELRRLAKRAAGAAHAAMPAEEIARIKRQAAEQAQAAVKRIQEELHQAREELRREREELQRQREELRREREELRRRGEADRQDRNPPNSQR